MKISDSPILSHCLGAAHRWHRHGQVHATLNEPVWHANWLIPATAAAPDFGKGLRQLRVLPLSNTGTAPCRTKTIRSLSLRKIRDAAASPSSLLLALLGSGSLTSQASGELDVLGHDRDALRVDGTEVGVLKESDEVSLSGLLQCKDRLRLELEVRLHLLGDLLHEALKGKLADQELSRLLVLADLAKGQDARAIAGGLLHGAHRRGSLASRLWPRDHHVLPFHQRTSVPSPWCAPCWRRGAFKAEMAKMQQGALTYKSCGVCQHADCMTDLVS